MEVICKLYGPPREAVGKKQVRCDVATGATVEDVLRTIIERHPALEETLYASDGALRESIGVLMNRTNISQREGLATAVEEGDELLITPPIHGG